MPVLPAGYRRQVPHQEYRPGPRPRWHARQRLAKPDNAAHRQRRDVRPGRVCQSSQHTDPSHARPQVLVSFVPKPPALCTVQASPARNRRGTHRHSADVGNRSRPCLPDTAASIPAKHRNVNGRPGSSRKRPCVIARQNRTRCHRVSGATRKPILGRVVPGEGSPWHRSSSTPGRSSGRNSGYSSGYSSGWRSGCRPRRHCWWCWCCPERCGCPRAG